MIYEGDVINFLDSERERCLIYLAREPLTYGGLEFNISAYDFAIDAIRKNDRAITECKETIRRLEKHHGKFVPDGRGAERIDASIFAYKNILRILEETT